ncbi:MAG: hypothetical protein A2V90_02995 [Gammaproteobacteria bacterium RBG_16_57_12]|nr:MAG: hypothetical protein A2V90_02995 [Gammaproteobacteria bacterium RBG_16_57_12]
MAQFSLSIPKQDPGRRLSIGCSSGEISAWLDALPIADPEKALLQLLPALEEMNQCVLDIRTRYQAMKEFGALADKFIEPIRKKYLMAPFPLSGKNYERAVQIKRLLQEMATGYKIVFSHYMADKRDLSKADIVLCLCLAVDYMARLILENYLLYEALVPKVWRELHTLFSFSSQLGFHNTVVEMAGNRHSTLERKYMQVLLLAAIKPYRLMSGEAQQVFEQMEEWSQHCSTQIPLRGWQANGEIIVDLSSDEAPYHAPTGAVYDDINNLRVLNIEALKQVIQKRADAVASDVKNSPAFALARRQQRNMLSRLVSGWRSKNDRQDERAARQQPIDVVCGLVDSHNIFSTEINVEAGQQPLKKPLSLDDLSLTPHEDSWGTAPKQKVEMGRASQFRLDDPTHDVWEKKHTLHTEQDTPPEPAAPVRHYLARQTDVSTGGIGAAFDIESGLKPRVGDLVCYRTSGESAWNLGQISWLAMSHTEGGGFGIMSFGPLVRPIFVKALRGVGEGGDFMRALLTQADRFEAPEARLILPAAIYDIDTVLTVQGARPALRLRLTELQETSESFTCFAFRIIEN